MQNRTSVPVVERTDWAAVLLLWFAGLGAAAQYGKISVVFDRLPGLYPDAGASLGFAVSLVGFVGILLGVSAGVIVARAGYRRSLLAALTVAAALSVYQASLPPLPLFLASRILEGAAHLAIVVAAPTLIAQLSARSDRGVTLTLWGTFFGVAFAVLAWAGLPLADAGGVPALLLAHGIYCALMVALLWRLLPSLPGTGAAEAPSWRALGQAHLRLYRTARLAVPGLAWIFYTASFLSLLTVLPPFLPEAQRAYAIGALPLVSIAVSMTLGVWLLRFMPAIAVVQAGFLSAAAAMLAVWIWPGAVAPVLCVGAALGLIQGATFAAVPQLNAGAEDQALANGGMAQAGNFGNTVGTPLLVVVIGLAGFGGMVAVLAALLAGGALALALTAPRATGPA